jgi:hypothetical protein
MRIEKTVVFESDMPTTRSCGDCQLCCKLLPVRGINKPANTTCQFQKFHKGCTVYHTDKMPMECGMWNCRWLVNDDTADQSRPDRSHYVIDVMPDFVDCTDNETGEQTQVEVVQVWVDPNHRDAHRDPALRRYLHRRAAEGVAAIIRYSSSEAFVLMGPPFMGDGQWHEIAGESSGRTHTAGEIIDTLGEKYGV